MEIERFIERHGIKMRATETDRNPNTDMPEGSSHWYCTLRCGPRRMVVIFSMGSALTGPPTIADVLDCLASDASGFEDAEGDFATWCGDYGYDTDSRKAERTFRAVERQAKALRRMLGNDDDYGALLHNVERL